ncbi:MAG: hypothetical protein ABSB35_00670 [Bryobacteraceae bacterium]
MAFCPNCGAETTGKFCAKCGSPVAADAGNTPHPQPSPAPSPSPSFTAAGLSDNMASALCYLITILTGVLFLVLEPYNRNRTVRFHAFQAIFFGAALLAAFIAANLISIMLLPIAFVGPAIAFLLHLAVGLGGFFLWLMLMYKAYNKERWVLPVIGPMAEKQA